MNRKHYRTKLPTTAQGLDYDGRNYAEMEAFAGIGNVRPETDGSLSYKLRETDHYGCDWWRLHIGMTLYKYPNGRLSNAIDPDQWEETKP